MSIKFASQLIDDLLFGYVPLGEMPKSRIEVAMLALFNLSDFWGGLSEPEGALLDELFAAYSARV